MKHPKQLLSVLVLVALILIAATLLVRRMTPNVVEGPAEGEEMAQPSDPLHFSINGEIMQVTAPLVGDTVTSPMTATGSVTGAWYFEATFPVVLTNWDGVMIAEGYAEAQGDWMTEETVPFEATLTFDSPYSEGDPAFMQSGFLILQKANASGLPENDDAVEIPVLFE